MSGKILDYQNESVQSNQLWSVYFGVLEGLVIVGLIGFQVYYIMHMLENKRLLL
jgi:hypothetical protein